MPKLIKVYIRQVMVGFLLSAIFVSALLALNVANLWHLVTHVGVGWIAVLMLWIFNGIVFAGVQFALALPREESENGRPGKPRLTAVLKPIPITAETNSRAS
ncbi:MAG: hypothetical protein AAGF94_08450 [Pseudomonadota bacterium]